MTTDVSVTPELLYVWYEQMLRIREFETRAIELWEKGLIRGSLHTYIGMEGGAVGACSALGDGDGILTYHRGHGHCLAKGLDPRRMFAELMGREDGYCRGKGGTMHIASPADGVLGADGVVGGMLPVAVGVAYAMKLRRQGTVAMVFFGEGAVNQGSFHESLNLAAIYRVPLVFVCENNMWALNTRSALVTAVRSLTDLAAQYGVAGESVDATDVGAVFDAANTAVTRCRDDSGPSLLELKTYRWQPHSAYAEADPRPPDELAEWRAKDPIARLEARLQSEGGATEAELTNRRDAVRNELDEAVAAASSSPPPSKDAAFEDTFASSIPC